MLQPLWEFTETFKQWQNSQKPNKSYLLLLGQINSALQESKTQSKSRRSEAERWQNTFSQCAVTERDPSATAGQPPEWRRQIYSSHHLPSTCLQSGDGGSHSASRPPITPRNITLQRINSNKPPSQSLICTHSIMNHRPRKNTDYGDTAQRRPFTLHGV